MLITNITESNSGKLAFGFNLVKIKYQITVEKIMLKA